MTLHTSYKSVLLCSQIVIMAKHYSGGTLGDIAVDDLGFENCMQPLPPGSCSSGKFQCDSRHCIDLSAKCDFEQDCCDGSEEKNSTCAKYNRYCHYFSHLAFIYIVGSRQKSKTSGPSCSKGG